MKETLCWKCSVPGTGGCSWDRDFTPVRGWTAIPTRIWLNYKKSSTGSYCVESCPLFRPAQRWAGKITDESLMACAESGLDDETIAVIFDADPAEVYAKRMALAAKEIKKAVCE